MLEVYAEYLFLENLIMNFIILHITGYFGKYQGNNFKLLLGAIIGALYAFIFFFPSLHFLLSFSMKIIVSMLIVIISFTPYKFKSFIKYMAIFYFVSFVFGGAAFAFFYFTNFQSIISNGVFYTKSFNIRMLLYSVATAYFLFFLCLGFIKNKIIKEKVFKEIAIIFDHKRKTINALIDTGNSLSDPISNFPVVVVEYSAIEDILPDKVKEIFIDNNFDRLDKITDILENSNWINRFRLIPYTSLGKNNGILLGFKPDNVELFNEGNKITINKIIIGISTNKLSKNDDYKALINPDILI